MGIDAEIMVRYSSEKPTEAQLARWSWDLCRSIGAKHFFITDGLPPAEYRKASEAWHAAFKAHPEYPLYDRLSNHGAGFNLFADDKGRREVHARILANLGKAPELRRRAIDFACSDCGDDEWYEGIPVSHHAPGLVYTQDGDPILANPGEWLLKVSLWTRYYSIGYERGDILTICAVAEWIESNIPHSEVWYGGDSSGVEMEPFPNEKRAALRAHLYSQTGRDYFQYSRDRAKAQPKPCGLCIPGEPRFNEFGSGRNYSAVSCAGCGKSFETSNNGATWTERKEKD